MKYGDLSFMFAMFALVTVLSDVIFADLIAFFLLVMAAIMLAIGIMKDDS